MGGQPAKRSDVGNFAEENAAPQVGAAKSGRPKKFPKEALGFEFGATSDQAKERCTSLDHEWRAEGESYECTGAAVNVGAPIQTTLSYCGEGLCELRAYVTLAKDEVGQREFVRFKRALVKQYGEPADEDARVPQVCRERFMACIVDGRARWEAKWEWPDGSSIRAKAGTDGSSPVIGIRYRKGDPKVDSSPSGRRIDDDASSFDPDAF